MNKRLCGPMVALALLALDAVAGEIDFQLLAVSHGNFALPHDIVLSPDGLQLFVADNGNDRIAVLDSATLAEVFSFGHGLLREPHDVAFGPDGKLHVADTGNDRVAVFTLAGERARLVSSIEGTIRRPEGVAVHADGRVFATGAGTGNLVVFRDGTPVSERGGFASPHDVEFDSKGMIWIADAGNDRMVALTDALDIAGVLEGSPYEFRGPRYLDFDGGGRMFVADKYSHRILVLDEDGGILANLGGEEAETGSGQFDRPEGVELRGDRAWFSDTYNNRIVLYTFRMVP